MVPPIMIIGTVNSQGQVFREFPSDLGVFAGGDAGGYINNIDYINIQSAGNSISYGTLSLAYYASGAGSSSTRAIIAGRYNSSGVAQTSIDYFSLSSKGNGSLFGALTQARSICGAASNSTRAVFAGGYQTSAYSSVIDYVTIATTGDATNFGTTSLLRWGSTGVCSSTRGVFCGGYQSSGNTVGDTCDYVTIDSTGNATFFGNLGRNRVGHVGVSSSTRGVLCGGESKTEAALATMDYITIASTGNGTNFGNLSVARASLSSTGGASNKTRGVIQGGYTSGANSNIMDYITIATTGNAIDFGDLTSARTYSAGTSNSHGGL